jgi:hypothetical protein
VSGGSLLWGLRLGAWGRRIILRLKKKELLWIQIRVSFRRADIEEMPRIDLNRKKMVRFSQWLFHTGKATKQRKRK